VCNINKIMITVMKFIDIIFFYNDAQFSTLARYNASEYNFYIKTGIYNILYPIT